MSPAVKPITRKRPTRPKDGPGALDHWGLRYLIAAAARLGGDEVSDPAAKEIVTAVSG